MKRGQIGDVCPLLLALPYVTVDFDLNQISKHNSAMPGEPTPVKSRKPGARNIVSPRLPNILSFGAGSPRFIRQLDEGTCQS